MDEKKKKLKTKRKTLETDERNFVKKTLETEGKYSDGREISREREDSDQKLKERFSFLWKRRFGSKLIFFFGKEKTSRQRREDLKQRNGKNFLKAVEAIIALIPCQYY